MSKRVIRIFTAYWGDYEKIWRRYSRPSVERAVERLEREDYQIEWDTYAGASNLIDPLLEEIKICINTEALFFLCPPDTIFGAETLYNLVKVAENKPHCIAFPHFRARLKATSENPQHTPWTNLPITNQELARGLLHNAHDTFNKAFDELTPNLTHAGISVRKIDDDLYSIVHNLPTIYLANFLQQDLDFFLNAKRAMGDNAWGQWDRGWLELLTEQNRVKVVGSSDMAMAVELTSDDRTPPLWNGLQYNDLYDHRRRRPYNMVYNKFLYVLKG